MSIWDDLKKTANDLLSGQLGNVVGDVGRTVHDVVDVGGGLSGGGTASTGGVSVGASSSESIAAAQRAAMAAKAAQGTAAAGPASCCDRYRFDSGFLVDGATGSVWKYDEKSNSFEEVEVHRHKSKQALINALVETRLSALRCQYEQEVLSTTPPANRAALLTAFEKEHLAPIQDAAKATQY